MYTVYPNFDPNPGGLGKRSIFYPGSSAGSTFKFGIVEDTRTRVRVPLRTFLSKEMLARASYVLHTCLPGSPGFGSKFG